MDHQIAGSCSLLALLTPHNRFSFVEHLQVVGEAIRVSLNFHALEMAYFERTLKNNMHVHTLLPII